MNPKIRKIRRDIERTERKAAELTADLKRLKFERTKLEDAEIARRVREAAAKEGADIDAVLDELVPGGDERHAGTSMHGSGVGPDGKDA